MPLFVVVVVCSTTDARGNSEEFVGRSAESCSPPRMIRRAGRQTPVGASVLVAAQAKLQSMSSSAAVGKLESPGLRLLRTRG